MNDHAAPKITLVGEQDRLFSQGPYPKPFAFNEQVAKVFDDMVSRSVPLYCEVIATLLVWAKAFSQENGKVYDIGCSTGTTLLALAESMAPPTCFVGIDNSEAMLARAQEKLANLPSQHRLQLLCQDALSVSYEEASLVVMNYTLQFISVAKRADLLQKIAKGLRPGGLLFLSEKIRSPNPSFQEAITHAYEHFKRQNGYSQTEIERKKEALDQVLIPFTLGEQMDLLRASGFSYCEPVLKWHNFVTIVAKK